MKLKSLENFDESINKTLNLYRLVNQNINFTKGFIEYFGIEKLSAQEDRKRAEGYKNILNMEIPNENLEYFSEISFVAMFSNFELFQVDLLKELWTKYSKSFDTNTGYTYNEIKDFTSIKKFRDYIIDKEANCKSINIADWGKYLENTFKITPFETKRGNLLDGIIHMGQIRDALMHSGGKVSSILLSKLKKYNYEGEKYNIGDQFLKKWTYDKIFIIQAGLLKEVHNNIQKWASVKNKPYESS
ncbi:hypothetical protein KJ816_02860 [Patescibacteria group bacterium]|nr:hypothetical protein [Patescibacteria group bacterium]